MKRVIVAVLLVFVCSSAFAQFPKDWLRNPIDLPTGPWVRRDLPFTPGDLWGFCESWGFESDWFTSWNCQSGTFGAATTDTDCTTSAQHALVAPGLDSQGMQQVDTDGATRAVRIGDMQPGGTIGNGAALTRTFTVTQQNALLHYSYALVLQDFGHPAALQPYFSATATVGGVTRYSFTKVANATDSFFSASGATLLRRWSCGIIDLRAFIGQQATVRFEAHDCQPGGHYGYAYVDFPCAPRQVNLAIPEHVCEGGPVVADGRSNSGVVDHFWSVERSDEQYGRNPSEEVMSWFAGPVTSSFDVAAFAAQQGRPMTCGNYYRVKLAVKTECEPWLETVKLVYVDCLSADAGPDRTICATNPQPVTLGSPSVPGLQYKWEANGVVLGNESTLTVTPAQTTTYELTATKDSCSRTSRVRVEVVPDFKPQISVCYCAPSRTTLTVTLPSYSGPTPKFRWSTGETSARIQVDQNVQTPIGSTISYSVSVDNGCDSRSASITLPTVPPRSLIAPNAIAPYSAIPANRVLRIHHLGMNLSERPAYDATQYILTVFDRWGGLIYEGRSGLNGCAGVGNGEIVWDGVANRSDPEHNIYAGSVVPIGEYTYLLEIADCQEFWKYVKVNGEVRPKVTVLK